MRVLSWNRSPKNLAGVEFVSLDRLLAESHVVSLHLLLNDETRGFLARERIAALRPGVILFNTEPLPADHPLTKLQNVTLSAHSAFRTPEASENLIGAAWAHCRRIARG